MNIYEKLAKIQQKMKAPKDLYNSFGGYAYRNAESILEAAKPYEEEYNVMFLISDRVECIGERYYVIARATIYDLEKDSEGLYDNISVEAYAREQDTKKGMDASQITGATSSYARKYALNGLLLLDDTKDPDSDEDTRNTGGVKVQDSGTRSTDKIDAAKVESLKKEAARIGMSNKGLLGFAGVDKLEDLTLARYKFCMDEMSKKPDKAPANKATATKPEDIEEGLPFR